MITVPPTGNETNISWLWLFFAWLLLNVGSVGDPIDPAQENPLRKAITPITWVTPG